MVTVTPSVTSHDRSQVPSDQLGTVTRRLQNGTLMLHISSLPNLLPAWYSALYCPCNHSDINANVGKLGKNPINFTDLYCKGF